MHALLCDTPDDEQPTNGVSEFDALFGQIVRSNTAGVVVYDCGGQDWEPSIHEDLGGEDGLFNFDGFKVCPFGVLVPRRQFIELLQYVSGFWTDYWLFDSESDVNCGAMDLSATEVGVAQFPVRCTHMFSNVDGSYWVMFTERDDDIQAVESLWHRTRRFEVSLMGG